MARKATIEKSMLGEEPSFDGVAKRHEIINALNYYAYLYNVRDTKKWIIQWMQKNEYDAETISIYDASNHSSITQTMASIARMLMRGLHDEGLNSMLVQNIENVVQNMKNEMQPNVVRISKRQPNVVICEIDEHLDAFYRSEYKKTPELKLDLSSETKTSDINAARKLYSGLLAELHDGVGYEHLKKAQIKRYIEFVENIVSQLTLGGTVTKRRQTKPRVKKPVSADKIVSKMNYLKDHGTYSSIDPTSIVSAKILWTFNVKTRKLAKYIAADETTLSVNRTTIINFDPENSYHLTLRKPDDIVPCVMTDGKRKVEQRIKQINAKRMPPNGRMNSDTLILRAFK